MNILLKFREYYGLQEFSLKELDKYLWQFGKFYFLRNINERGSHFAFRGCKKEQGVAIVLK